MSYVHLHQTDKKRLSQVVGAGGQRAKDQRKENAVLTGKETALFVFFVLRLKHLHRIFFPSNLEIILFYFKPSIKTSHAALPGWQQEAVCARVRVNLCVYFQGCCLPSLVDTAVNYCVFNYI